MGFKKIMITGKHSKLIFSDAVVVFPTTKIAKKIQKVPKHLQKYNLLCLKPSQSRTNMDSQEWTRKKWSKSGHKKSLEPKTEICCLMKWWNRIIIHKCPCIWTYALLLHFCREKRNVTFRKWGGGSKAVWNFSENSSVLVAWPLPNYCNFTLCV